MTPMVKESAGEQPSPLTPTPTETMHATGAVRGAKAMPRAKGPADDEPSTLTQTVTRRAQHSELRRAGIRSVRHRAAKRSELRRFA